MTQELIKDLTDDPEVIEKNSVPSDVLRVSGKNPKQTLCVWV